jgi:hypothetical protein
MKKLLIRIIFIFAFIVVANIIPNVVNAYSYVESGPTVTGAVNISGAHTGTTADPFQIGDTIQVSGTAYCSTNSGCYQSAINATIRRADHAYEAPNPWVNLYKDVYSTVNTITGYNKNAVSVGTFSRYTYNLHGATSFTVPFIPGNYEMYFGTMNNNASLHYSVPFTVAAPRPAPAIISLTVTPGNISAGGTGTISYTANSGTDFCDVYIDWGSALGVINSNSGSWTTPVLAPGGHTASLTCYNNNWVWTGWYSVAFGVNVNGGWSGWSAQDNSCPLYSAVTRTQTRSCNSPSPAYGGTDCAGPSTQTYVVPACTPVINSVSVSPNPVPYGSSLNITYSCSNTSWGYVIMDGSWDWSNAFYSYSGSGVSTTPGLTSIGGHTAWVICFNNDNVHNGYWQQVPFTVSPPIVNGGWSGWSAQDNTCAYSAQTKTQTRSCNSPVPSGGGAGCSGSSTQTYNVPACIPSINYVSVSPTTVPYNTPLTISFTSNYGYYCHVIMDGVWDWTDTGYFGSRTSTTPALTAVGNHTAWVHCYNTDWVLASNGWYIVPFTVSPPIINGGWSGWSAQDNTCAYSAQTKTQSRSCNSPTPAYGGAACSGPSTQTYNVPACASNITSLSVSPNVVPYGGSANIYYSCTNGYYSHIILDDTWAWQDSGVYSSRSPTTTGPLTAVGSHYAMAYCYNSDMVPSANSWSRIGTFTVVNAASPTPDIRVTAWSGSNSNGPLETYSGDVYTLSWAAVANATSCALDGSAVSVSGGSQTRTASSITKTHTLSCTNATGQSASDTVTITVPPPPTAFTSSCNTAGNLVTFNWTVPAPYTGGYIRPTAPFYIDVGSGTTTSVAITPGQTYSGLYLHTRNQYNGAWSDIKTLPDFTCNPPSTGPLTATNCPISLGASSCNTNLTWNTTYPIGISQVTTPTGIVVANANSSAGTSYPVSNGARNFYLYNNNNLLSTATATASCVGGTHWGTTTCISDNNAPTAPTITGNTSFYKNVLQNFIVTGTDPDADQVRYGIDWNNDNVAEIWTGFVASGVSMIPTNSWPTPGTYSFKALTQDIKGANSPWSPLFTVTVTNPPVPAAITSFTVDKNKIEFGQAIKLTWTSTDAPSCTMASLPLPSINISDLAITANNNKSFKPAKTTIYTLTCSGPGGNDSKSLTVTVGKIKPVIKEF